MTVLSPSWKRGRETCAAAVVCLAHLPVVPMLSGHVVQYGANQHSSQQAPAAAQTPAAPLARPQQLPAPGTYSKASYNRPVTQARPAAATPAATPAFGRPTVQAPAGSRNASSGRPVVIPPASSKHAAATAPAGKNGLHGQPGPVPPPPLAHHSVATPSMILKCTSASQTVRRRHACILPAG